MRVLENLEPKRVFYYFEEICSIPHGSGNTKQISDYLVSFASLNVGKMNIAEDIVHDVFIKLWQNKGNIEPVDSLRPYLLRAVHNNSLNILRNESKCLEFRNEYVEKIEAIRQKEER